MAQRSTYRASLLAASEPTVVVPVIVPKAVVPLAGPSAPGDVFDAAFLAAESLDAYLAYAATEAFDPRYALLSKTPDWSPSKDRIPLALCEFLAYKSVLAYHNDGEIKAHFEACGWRGIDKDCYLFFDASPVGDAQGFGFVSGDTAYIVMRGSTSFTDWMANLDPTLSTNPKLDKETLELIRGAHPQRLLGFAKAWAHVAPQIETWVRAQGSSVKQLCFSGHSQGGALAILGAHDFAQRKVGNVGAVVTFAAPKVGGDGFIADYNALGLGQRTLRCESPEDAVTWLALHQGLQQPGHTCLVHKRPMISGMEKVWAALLFIAGWRDASADPKTSSGKAGDASAPPSSGSKPETNAEKKDEAASKRDAPADKATEQTHATANKPQEIDGQKAIAIVVVAVALFLAFLIARKAIIRLRAHGASKRYALFFSTLAYQRIRNARIKDFAAATDKDFERVSADLDTHLRYIRGADDTIEAYAKLKNRPLRVRDKAMFDYLTKDTKDVTDEKGPSGHYPGYIW